MSSCVGLACMSHMCVGKDTTRSSAKMCTAWAAPRQLRSQCSGGTKGSSHLHQLGGALLEDAQVLHCVLVRHVALAQQRLRGRGVAARGDEQLLDALAQHAVCRCSVLRA